MEGVKEVSNPLVECQICAQNTHLADRCPFSYMVCKQPNCNGIRILHISEAGRKFLKCQHSSCIGFQWLDQAILQSRNVVGASSSSSSSITTCFTCEDPQHWSKDCPWKPSPCSTQGCSGTRYLMKSGTKYTKDRQYLKCKSCGKFQWLNDAKDEQERVIAAAARMLLGPSIDAFCNTFKNMNMK